MTRGELEMLIARVEARSTSRDSFLHGSHHWRCVSLLGIGIARQTVGGDALVAFLFGLFHDAMRENDDDDPDHGKRGAALLREFFAQGWLPILSAQLYFVLYACETHTTAPPTTRMPVGVCYDSDRLTLWRVGVTPDAAYLSTAFGQEQARLRRTKGLHGQPLEWSAVLDVLFA